MVGENLRIISHQQETQEAVATVVLMQDLLKCQPQHFLVPAALDVSVALPASLRLDKEEM